LSTLLVAKTLFHQTVPLLGEKKFKNQKRKEKHILGTIKPDTWSCFRKYSHFQLLSFYKSGAGGRFANSTFRTAGS